jgi:hypothetical protein
VRCARAQLIRVSSRCEQSRLYAKRDTRVKARWWSSLSALELGGQTQGAWPLHVYVRVSASYQVKSPRALGLMSEKSRCGEVPRVVRTARRRTGLADDDEAGSDCSSRRTTSSFTLCTRVAKEKQ